VETLPVQTMPDPATNKPIQYRTIGFTDQNNKPHVAKVTYAPLDSVHGIWQLLSIV
jgi:hypothetical protein